MVADWLRLRAQAFLFAKGVYYRMTLGARGMLIDGDKVLLIKHTYLPGWQFPGGGVDPGETVEAAFRREMMEETGHKVTGPATLFGFYHNVQATNRDHVALFVAREFEVARVFAPNREIADMGWFSRHDLPDDIAASARQRVAEVFDDLPPRDTW